MAAKSGRFLVASALVGAALALGIFACAGSGTQQASTPSTSESVQDVVVESEAGLSRVTLVGLAEPVFTAFQQTDPDRLIVDLAGVDWQASRDPIAVHDGTILEMTVAPFAAGSDEPMTRVELSLASATDYDVRPGPRGLVIGVSPLAEMGSLDEPAGDSLAGDSDPWTAPTGDLASESADSMDAEPMDAEATPVATHPASTLERIDAHAAGTGLVIHLIADGSVESAATFPVADPPRLVVDLAGMKSSVPKEKVEVGAARVQRVRVGAHADKVRVVVDGEGSPDPFDGRRVQPVPNGLVIALGEGPEVDAAIAQASSMPIAPPVQRFDFSRLPPPGCPWLVVQGDADELVDFANVRSWVASYDEPPELYRVRGRGTLLPRPARRAQVGGQRVSGWKNAGFRV